MQRITISIDEALATELDELFADEGYQSRSEGMRDLVRQAVEQRRRDRGASEHSVGVLSYIYDRTVRTLPQRLADIQHAHHNLVSATIQVRLDHEYSLEAVVLRGSTNAVRSFADRLKAERGVRFGDLNLVGVNPSDEHDGASDHEHHGHLHLSPGRG